MLNKKGYIKVLDAIKYAMRTIRNLRATGIIANRLTGHIEIEGWNFSSDSNAVRLSKDWGATHEGETSMDFFLNMVDIVNKQLGIKLNIEIGGYSEIPNLSASLTINVPVTLRQRLPNINTPKVDINDKPWLPRKNIMKPSAPQRIYIFVIYGSSSDCEFVVEEETETVINKSIKLTGKCAEAVAAMSQ